MTWDTPTVDRFTTGVTARTTSHTVGAGSNRVLYALICTGPGAVSISGTPTYNGVNCTQLLNSNASPIFSRLYVYRLVAPATGAHDFVVNFSASTMGTVTLLSADAVDQVTPEDTIDTDTTFTTTTTPSATTPSATGDMVLDIIISGFMSGTPSATVTDGTQTEMVDDWNNGALNEFLMLVSRKAGAASVTMGWTLSVSASGYHYQMNVNAAAAATDRAKPWQMDVPRARRAIRNFA